MIEIYFTEPSTFSTLAWTTGNRRFNDWSAALEWIKERRSCGFPLFITGVRNV